MVIEEPVLWVTVTGHVVTVVYIVSVSVVPDGEMPLDHTEVGELVGVGDEYPLDRIDLELVGT